MRRLLSAPAVAIRAAFARINLLSIRASNREIYCKTSAVHDGCATNFRALQHDCVSRACSLAFWTRAELALREVIALAKKRGAQLETSLRTRLTSPPRSATARTRDRRSRGPRTWCARPTRRQA